MPTVYLYRVYCATEGQYVTTWATEPPTTCPNNNTHTIDVSSIVIIDSISSEEIEVKSTMSGTNGHYKTIGYTIDIEPGVNIVTTKDISYPYATSVRGSRLVVRDENIGDNIEVVAAPNTQVGIITSDVNIGDTTISVSSTTHTDIGYRITLNDGTHTSELGEVFGIDSTNNTITVATPSDQSYSAATPTFVEITVPRIENLDLFLTGPIELGSSEIGGTTNPKNTIMRLLYTNKSSDAKKFQGILELFY